MNEIAGIVVAIALLIAYTTCFIVIIVKIFSKHSFDLEFQKERMVIIQKETTTKLDGR